MLLISSHNVYQSVFNKGITAVQSWEYNKNNYHNMDLTTSVSLQTECIISTADRFKVRTSGVESVNVHEANSGLISYL